MIGSLLFVLGSSVGLGVSLGIGITRIKEKRNAKMADAIFNAYMAGRKDEREHIKRKVEKKFGATK